MELHDNDSLAFLGVGNGGYDRFQSFFFVGTDELRENFFDLDVRVFQKFACVIQVVINRCQFSNTTLMLSNAVVYRGF